MLALTRRPEQREALKALGAHRVVVSDEGWTSEVAKSSPGGVDIVLDVVGGTLVTPLLQVLRPGGHIHLIGYAGGTATGFDMFDAIRRAVTIHVGSGGSRSSFEALVRAIEVNGIRPAVARSYAAPDIAEAFAQFARGGTLGKLAVEIP